MISPQPLFCKSNPAATMIPPLYCSAVFLLHAPYIPPSANFRVRNICFVLQEYCSMNDTTTFTLLFCRLLRQCTKPSANFSLIASANKLSTEMSSQDCEMKYISVNYIFNWTSFLQRVFLHSGPHYEHMCNGWCCRSISKQEKLLRAKSITQGLFSFALCTLQMAISCHYDVRNHGCCVKSIDMNRSHSVGALRAAPCKSVAYWARNTVGFFLKCWFHQNVEKCPTMSALKAIE